MPAVQVSATIVTYGADADLFARTLRSLSAAIIHARAAGLLAEAAVYVVDNGPREASARVPTALTSWDLAAGRVEIISGHGNVGYGRANNFVLEKLTSDVHLILNPDIELERDTLSATLLAFNEHPEVGLLAPAVFSEHGARQYLCKRYPSLWVLFLRGFAPPALQRRFAARLEHYEMRDVIAERFVAGVPLASGCFMAARTALFKRVRGFDPRFFLYFEDYDLSLRMGREAQVAYVPTARIVHHGGEASRKGWRHVAWFMQSAWRFFSTHGWKIA